jgi:hypothetical protein
VTRVPPADPIRIDGLVQFQKQLRAIDSELPKTLRVVGNAAGQLIVDWAKPRVPTRTGRAKGSIRVTSSQRQSQVTGGGKRVPWYPWLDFGGKVGPKKSVHRAFIHNGRYIYAGYTARRDDVQAVLLSGLIDTCRAAGVEVD